MERFHIHELSNGLTLLGERMENVASAAMTLLLPAGASHDPEGADGAAAVTAEWCFRGAGGRDTRALHDALDDLGVQHSENVQSEHMQFSAAQLGRNLPEVLKLYADIVLRPRLHDETFEPCRDLAMQDLDSLEDEPAHKCNMLLREKFYPSPLGRCVYGSRESLASLTAERARSHAKSRFSPAGAILSAAGNIDWDSFRSLVENVFSGWRTPEPPAQKLSKPVGGFTHIKKDSAQTHLALAHKTVPMSHDSYYAARLAAQVLAGGMSSRLFTEVREKRGLVYTVSSRYNTLKNHAGMFTYAGTRPEVAQETFDVTVGELRRLAEGFTPDELARAKVQLRSSLIMQLQSTTSRANALAGDWYHLGRLRSTEEISNRIEQTPAGEILEYLRDYPAKDFTVLVVGKNPIDAAAMNG